MYLKHKAACSSGLPHSHFKEVSESIVPRLCSHWTCPPNGNGLVKNGTQERLFSFFLSELWAPLKCKGLHMSPIFSPHYSVAGQRILIWWDCCRRESVCVYGFVAGLLFGVQRDDEQRESGNTHSFFPHPGVRGSWTERNYGDGICGR